MKWFLFKTFLATLLLVLGLLCLLLAFHSYTEVRELDSWELMTVDIVSSQVRKESRSKGATYCPNVRVGFMFAGEARESELQISQLPCSPIEQSALNTARDFGVGKTIDVYVNPENPSGVRFESYSLGWGFYVTLVIGCFALLFMAYLPFIKLTKASKGRD